MSGEIEAAGALATAGLAAKTLEGGGHGAGDGAVGDGSACANCRAAVTGVYCAACGQPAHVHRSLGHFLEEAVHGLFHFDTKAWRTVPMAAFRPGTLTFDYIHGRRARYISPVALFLFTVFLMFFVFALLGDVKGGGATTMEELRAEVTKGEADVRAAEAAVVRAKAAVDTVATTGAGKAGDAARARGDLVGATAELRAEHAVLAAARARLARREARIEKLRTVRARLDAQAGEARAKNDADTLSKIATARAIIDSALANPAGPPDSVKADIDQAGEVNINVAVGPEDGLKTLFEQIKAANAAGRITVNTGVHGWDETIRHKLENPELAWYKIQNTAYKFSFLLAPISLPFIWLIFFWKRGVTLFDHAVFALYSLSFMSLLFIVLALSMRAPLANAAAGAVATAMSAAIPMHMFFHIKGAYALGWFAALWRTMAMLVFAVAALSIFLLAIILLGLLG